MPRTAACMMNASSHASSCHGIVQLFLKIKILKGDADNMLCFVDSHSIHHHRHFHQSIYKQKTKCRMFRGHYNTSSIAIALFFFICTGTFLECANAKQYTSGEIVSFDSMLYGAFETKIKASPGPGAITGFILIVADAGLNSKPWQELSFEVFGKKYGTYQTQIITPGPPENYPPYAPRTQHIVETTDPTIDFYNAFHTVRIEWVPDRLSFFLDGKKIREETSTQEYGQLLTPGKAQPMQIRFTLWAGYSDWSGHLDASNPPTSAAGQYIKYESWDAKKGTFQPGWIDEFNTFDSSRWQKASWTFDFAVNDFSPSNVVVQDGEIELKFSRSF